MRIVLGYTTNKNIEDSIMYIRSRFTDTYDWLECTTFDKNDTNYNRVFKSDIKQISFSNPPLLFRIIIGYRMFDVRVKEKDGDKQSLYFHRYRGILEDFIKDNYTQPPKFERLGEVYYIDENFSEYGVVSRTESDGSLVMSPYLLDFINHDKVLVVECDDCMDFRKKYNFHEPVGMITDFSKGLYNRDDYRVFSNFSFEASGIPIEGLTGMTYSEIGSELDVYVCTIDCSPETPTFDDSVMVESKGFDKKISFRKRK